MTDEKYLLDINDCFSLDFSLADGLSIGEIGSIIAGHVSKEIKNNPPKTQQKLDKFAKIL